MHSNSWNSPADYGHICSKIKQIQKNQILIRNTHKETSIDNIQMCTMHNIDAKKETKKTMTLLI